MPGTAARAEAAKSRAIATTATGINRDTALRIFIFKRLIVALLLNYDLGH
jgi:hypothetical protein